nr:hypothetical protein [Nonomuraea sp. MG754425]
MSGAEHEVTRVQVLIPLAEQPPTDAIGYRSIEVYPGGTLVSFIGVGLASWHRREEEIDDGDWYDAHDSIVRAATAEEAAPVLAAEAKRARRAALARRVRNLLTVNRYEPAADCHRPVAEELAGVSFGTEVSIPGSVAGTTHPTTVYVDQESGFVWTWIHNGLDNDDWSVNNLGGAVAVRHPLTPERQALIADLYAEYDNPAALAKEIGAAETAVAALLDARWTGRQIRDSRRLFRLSEPGDGAALAALTPGQWREAGWWDEFWRPPGFAPGDAARLADAGISPATARDLGGTVEEILAAGPPRLPADASRILILPPEGERTTSMWAVAGMSAELVSAYLAGSGGDQLRDRQAAQLLTERIRGGHDQGFEAALRIGALVDGAASGDAQVPQRLDAAVALLGGAGAVAGECGLGGLDRVDRVGLALEPSGFAVGPVDFDHVDVLGLQQAGQAGSVDAGAFDPDPCQVPEGAHPGQQGGVSGWGGGELFGAQDPADQVDHCCGVGVLVGVHAAGDVVDRRFFGCNGGHRRPVVSTGGRAARTGRARRTRQ